MDIKNTENNIKALEQLDYSSVPNALVGSDLHSLYNRHNVLLAQNSIWWAQCAKLLWVKKGDLNTCFFHKFPNTYRHKNRISAILDSS